MSCIVLTAITTPPPAASALTPKPAKVTATTIPPTVRVSAVTGSGATVSAVTTPPAKVVANTLPPTVKVTIGEVCAITNGELDALASTEGPLRTRDGGFFLLDPNNPGND